MASRARRKRSSGGAFGGHKQWNKGDVAIPYLRVSDVAGRGDDLISPEVQLDVIRRWADREEITLLDPVTDLDKSGRESMKRQIGSAIERVAKGEAQGIAVWKVSRWGRNLLDSLLNIAELQEAGGFIGSGSENLEDIETPMGRFSLTQMLAIAQLQSDQIGETWMNIHDYRRGQGLPHGGGARFGYDYHPDEKDPACVYTINPVTGPWLSKCYNAFVAGQSAASLVNELYDNGIRSTTGRPMIYRTLMNTMDSGFGAGLIVDKSVGKQANPNDWTFLPGAHKPVISEEIWKGYLRKRAEKQAPRERVATTKVTGLLVCASCGWSMKISWARKRNGDRYRRYVCNLQRSKVTSAKRGCQSPVGISQHKAEEIVLEWLRSNATGEGAHATAIARLEHAASARSDAEEVGKEIDRMKKRIRRTIDLITEEEDPETKADFKERLAEYRAEVKRLEVQKMELDVEADVSSIPNEDAFQALAANWEMGNPSMVNTALKKVIARVEVRRGPNKWSEVRVVPQWEAGTIDPEAGWVSSAARCTADGRPTLTHV